MSPVGAGHGEELSYVFRHHLFKNTPALKQTAREQAVRERMTKMLANFIKTGYATRLVGRGRLLHCGQCCAAVLSD